MCIGRHPLQNPGMIKPEIGKLPKSLVDRIPLVMYIPPPPEGVASAPIKSPEEVYSYPPKKGAPKPTPAPHRRRFRFLRRPKVTKGDNLSKLEAGEGGMTDSKLQPKSWEDHWEKEGYPFVVLEGNRAACAICLMDFEEPKRVGGENEKHEVSPAPSSSSPKPEATATTQISEEERDTMRLEDAGDGAQPLRLLACGHVFHVRRLLFSCRSVVQLHFRKRAWILG